MQKRPATNYLAESIVSYLQTTEATLENLSNHFRISGKELMPSLKYLQAEGIVQLNNRIVKIHGGNSKKFALTVYVYYLTESEKKSKL